MVTAKTLKSVVTAKVFVGKSLYGLEKEHFDNYLMWKACIGNHLEELEIEPPEILHVDSRLDRCIQVADFVAGAINRKYNSDDDHYYDKIKSRVSLSIDFFERKDTNCIVNPSLLHPIRLRAASSFSGRTYNTTYNNMHRD